MTSWSDLLLKSVKADVRERLPTNSSALQVQVERCVSRAQTGHPTFKIAPDVFVVFVAERLTDNVEIDDLHAEDLYLACGCVQGESAALTAFHDRFLPEIERGLRRLPTADAEDYGQVVWARLLVGDTERRPKIASYRGHGQLLHWLRVTVVRLRADVMRAPKQPQAPLSMTRIVDPVRSPEKAYLQEHYMEVLRRAFELAVPELTARQRTLLRQHFVEGMSTRALGALYGVDHRTTGRWIAKAREALWDRTRERVVLALGVPQAELDSIVRLIQSQLDISFTRLLTHSATTVV
ncbi:MAG: hypothetical protein JKY37_34600 [Nannocystaceae bacterium]|nr:hypothetical protein [Nannocystaceae bacterium]